jgi:hypothetical protein
MLNIPACKSIGCGSLNLRIDLIYAFLFPPLASTIIHTIHILRFPVKHILFSFDNCFLMKANPFLYLCLYFVWKKNCIQCSMNPSYAQHRLRWVKLCVLLTCADIELRSTREIICISVTRHSITMPANQVKLSLQTFLSSVTFNI